MWLELCHYAVGDAYKNEDWPASVNGHNRYLRRFEESVSITIP